MVTKVNECLGKSVTLRTKAVRGPQALPGLTQPSRRLCLLQSDLRKGSWWLRPQTWLKHGPLCGIAGEDPFHRQLGYVVICVLQTHLESLLHCLSCAHRRRLNDYYCRPTHCMACPHRRQLNDYYRGPTHCLPTHHALLPCNALPYEGGGECASILQFVLINLI